jgi:hypothetical protein
MVLDTRKMHAQRKKKPTSSVTKAKAFIWAFPLESLGCSRLERARERERGGREHPSNDFISPVQNISPMRKYA